VAQVGVAIPGAQRDEDQFVADKSIAIGFRKLDCGTLPRIREHPVGSVELALFEQYDSTGDQQSGRCADFGRIEQRKQRCQTPGLSSHAQPDAIGPLDQGDRCAAIVGRNRVADRRQHVAACCKPGRRCPVQRAQPWCAKLIAPLRQKIGDQTMVTDLRAMPFDRNDEAAQAP